MTALHEPINANPSHRRAVVIGASIAGLLAARVLSEHFTEVVLLERDAARPRGAAQGHAACGAPAWPAGAGPRVLEELFPGFTEALVGQGGLRGDIGTEVAVDANGRRFARRPAGVDGHGGEPAGDRGRIATPRAGHRACAC